MKLKILTISGSLRATSSNSSLLKAAEKLAPETMSISRYSRLNALPHFNPDLDVEPLPREVETLRQSIRTADGLVISSPEYARGVAGSMKNLLDWMVSDTEFSGKPVALFNASPRATHGLAALRLTLETMAARIIDDACVTLPLLNAPLDGEGIANDVELARLIRGALEAFARAIRRS